MQRALRAAALVALLLGPGACTRRPADVARQAVSPSIQILRTIPGAPGAYLLDTSGTSDAEHRSYSVPHPLDTVAAFYRAKLAQLGWGILSERADPPAGQLDLMAAKDSQSLWVHLKKNGEDAALVSLIAHGASAPAGTPPAARSGPRP